MRKKKVVILGAGITGLTSAFYLKDVCEVILLEKEDRVGGWMHTEKKGDTLFEKGPRTFLYPHHRDLWTLIQDLSLDNACIFSSKEAKKRFLFFKGKIEKIPTNALSALLSPLTRDLLFPLLSEWTKKPCGEDETLDAFARRRFGRKIAERFFDALSMGVYGVASSEVSVEACFHRLKAMERAHGSLTAALFASLWNKTKKESSSLFSFRGGTQTVIEALLQEIKSCVFLQEPALAISSCKEGICVKTPQRSIQADLLMSALPPQAIGGLLREVSQEAASTLQNISTTTLELLHLMYTTPVLQKKGFGYLVPKVEKLPLLGVVFDSLIFPQGTQTILTAIFNSLSDPLAGVSMVSSHLGIEKPPDAFHVTRCKNAVPILGVGHVERMEKVVSLLAKEAPRIILSGNYLQGVSVNDCVRSAKHAVKKGQDVLRTLSDRQSHIPIF